MYQPWATWIVRGWKLIETRTHNRFRSLAGKRILIHAGSKYDNSDLVLKNPYLTPQQIHYKPEEIVYGYIIGECLVQGIKLLDDSHSKSALINCGDTQRYGLFLNEIMMIEPIKVKGDRGIWYYDAELMQKVKASDYKNLSQ